MATWNEVMNNPVYANATAEKQQAIRDDYFSRVVEPRAIEMGKDVSAVRADFMSVAGGSAPSPAPVQQDPAAVQAPERMAKAPDTFEKQMDRQFNQVGNWLHNTTLEQKANDIASGVQSFGDSASNIKDWLMDTSLSEKAEAGSNLIGSLVDMGGEVIDYGKYATTGPSAEEFYAKYDVPESTSGKGMTDLARYNYEKLMSQAEQENQARIERGEQVVPIDTVSIREQAEQISADVLRDAGFDLATVYATPFKAAKTGATTLAKAANVAKQAPQAAAVVGGAEVAKNVLDDEEISKNVLESILLDRAFTALPDVKWQNKRQQNAAQSVVKGKEQFDKVIDDAAAVNEIDFQKERVLNGQAPDKAAMENVYDVNPEVRAVFESLEEATQAVPATKFVELEDTYRQMSREGVVNPYEFAERVDFPAAQEWLALRQGEMDTYLQVAKDRKFAELEQDLQSGSVRNYEAAQDLASQGAWGRRLFDTSGTEGASALSKVSSVASKATRFGFADLVSDIAKVKANKKVIQEAKDTIAQASDDFIEKAQGGREERKAKAGYGVHQRTKESLDKAIEALRRGQSAIDETGRIARDREMAIQKFDKMEAQAETDLTRAEKRFTRKTEEIQTAQNKLYKAESNFADAEAAVVTAKGKMQEARRSARAANQDAVDARRELNRILKSSASQKEVNAAKNALEKAKIVADEKIAKAEKLEGLYESAKNKVPELEKVIRNAEEGVKNAELRANVANEQMLDAADSIGQAKFERGIADEWFTSEAGKIDVPDMGALAQDVKGAKANVSEADRKLKDFLDEIKREDRAYASGQSMVGKDKLSTEGLLKGASAAGLYKAGDVAGLSEVTGTEGLRKAMATLHRVGTKDAVSTSASSIAARLSTRSAVGFAAVAVLGLPVLAVKAVIPIINTMAQANQKAGLLKGAQLIDKHVPKIKELEVKAAKATGESKVLLEAQLEAATEAFTSELSKIGDKELKTLNKSVEAARVASLMMNEDEE